MQNDYHAGFSIEASRLTVKALKAKTAGQVKINVCDQKGPKDWHATNELPHVLLENRY